MCSWLGQIRDIRATCIRIYIISISNNILTWVPKIHAYISVSTFVVASVCVSFAINLINESNHILTCIPKISTWEQVRGCVDFEICIQHVYACIRVCVVGHECHVHTHTCCIHISKSTQPRTCSHVLIFGTHDSMSLDSLMRFSPNSRSHKRTYTYVRMYFCYPR